MALKKNSALAGFCERFQSILDALDAFELDEDLEELNAQFEDVIFLMENIDEDDADAAEEIQGALEEMQDICADYQHQAQHRPELNQKALELDMALQMARRNLL